MLAQSNIARPYAQALFELAQAQNDLSGWNDRLQLLTAVSVDPDFAELAANPRVSSQQLADLIISICGERVGDEGKNLVKLLSRNGRIGAMQDIANAFSSRKDEAEKVIVATMVTAVVIDDRQRQAYAQALQSTLGRSVELEFKIDEQLIGGAVIRAGDWVVDGSVKTQLEQLEGAIRS